jgi:hypothetical protein
VKDIYGKMTPAQQGSVIAEATAAGLEDRSLQALVSLMEQGWLVVPPLARGAKPPRPEAGEVWISPKPGVESRLVVSIGPHFSRPSAEYCVFFRRKGEAEDVRPSVLGDRAWQRWAEGSDARPLPVPADIPSGPGL